MQVQSAGSVTLVLAVLFASPALIHAQRGQTSALSGTIRDGTGARLANVVVTITSPESIGGIKSARSDDQGRYRFVALQPGEYELTADRSGFETLQRNRIDLLPGLEHTVDLVLNVAAVSATVEVYAPAPTIDVRSSASPQIVERRVLESLPLPMNRSVHEYLNLAPGISGGVALGGAAFTNPIAVDGMRATDPAHDRPEARPVVNWVETLQVISVGASAEHGEYTSALLNVITRSGANRTSGLGEYWWTLPQWAKWNDLLTWWDASGQIGGPIARDRAWFFGGLDVFRHAWRPGGYAALPRTPHEPQARSREQNMLLKLTTAPGRAMRLEGFSAREWGQVINGNASPLTAAEAYASGENLHRLYNARFTWSRDTTLVEARYGRFKGWNSLGPADPSRRSGPPPHRDQATGAFSGNASSLIGGERSVSAVQAAVTSIWRGRGSATTRSESVSSTNARIVARAPPTLATPFTSTEMAPPS